MTTLFIALCVAVIAAIEWSLLSLFDRLYRADDMRGALTVAAASIAVVFFCGLWLRTY